MKIDIEIADDSPFLAAIANSIQSGQKVTGEEKEFELSGQAGTMRITCIAVSCLGESEEPK